MLESFSQDEAAQGDCREKKVKREKRKDRMEGEEIASKPVVRLSGRVLLNVSIRWGWRWGWGIQRYKARKNRRQRQIQKSQEKVEGGEV